MTDMGISLIPGVGEVTAARDVSADAYHITIKGEYDQWPRWMSLAMNFIGLVPEAGAVIKDVGRLTIREGGKVLGKEEAKIAEGAEQKSLKKYGSEPHQEPPTEPEEGKQNKDKLGEWRSGDPLPRVKYAHIDPAKFESYSMDPTNANNQGKWKAFEEIGYDLEGESVRHQGVEDVIAQVRKGLPNSPAIESKASPYGLRYRVEVELRGPNGKTGILVTTWQVDEGTDAPRMITNWLKGREVKPQGMKAKVGDTIVADVGIECDFSDRVIAAGTPGAVIEAYENPEGYAVDFEIPDKQVVGGYIYENVVISPEQFSLMSA